MRHETLQTALWWLCLFVAPLALIGREIFHHAGFTEHPGMYAYLSKPEGYQPEIEATQALAAAGELNDAQLEGVIKS